jgi:hypothetical protein
MLLSVPEVAEDFVSAARGCIFRSRPSLLSVPTVRVVEQFNRVRPRVYSTQEAARELTRPG